MEMSQTMRFEVTEPSAVGHVRRIASEIAERHGFDTAGVGRVAIVVTEAASNLVKYSRGGEVLLQTLVDAEHRGLDILTLDRGPGIANLAAAMRDGYSTSGSPGTGIGAIGRQADAFDVHSRPDHGVVLLARLWNSPAPLRPTVLVGGVNVCHPREEVSGDAWSVDVGTQRTRVMIADGLGHGPIAATAAHTASEVFEAHRNDAPGALLEHMHRALVSTRGAAIAVAQIDSENRVLRFAGIGNVSGTIDNDGHTRSVVSHHGIVGHDVRLVQEFTYPWPKGALLILHSDGIDTRWQLSASPGLSMRDPTLIAATLYRDHRRERDDATVVVLRDAA